MKKLLSMMMGFLTVILTAGCATVVYRVNPDSPPTMGAQEAKEALELSLSLAQKPAGIESVTFQGDELLIVIPVTSISNQYGRAGYYDISKEVQKQGKSFAVNVTFPNVTPRLTKSDARFYWKSEEDARSFVDAAYTLRTARFRERTSPLPSEGASAKSPSLIGVEKTPPKITITSLDATRSLKVVAKQSKIPVVGVAESKIGISEVTVNGLQTELDESGNFSAEIPLKVGRNIIVVTAVDILKNKTTHQFTVNREGGKVVQVKKEDFALEPGIPLAKYHALFIAVQDYESKDIGRLDYTISDARKLRDVLISNYTFEKENTILLENPDRRVIYKTLQGLRSKLTEKDNLLIFFAGHGYWLDDMKQGFWLPIDASGINDPSDWIPNSSIRDYIKAIKAKHILLIADACFSGGMFKLRDASPGPQVSIEKIYEQPSRKAITSGSMKTVPDRSVFLEFLAKRLKENNDMYMDAQKLYASLRDAVINNSPIHQTPLYGAIGEAGDEGGDFIFIKRQ